MDSDATDTRLWKKIMLNGSGVVPHLDFVIEPLPEQPGWGIYAEDCCYVCRRYFTTYYF